MDKNLKSLFSSALILLLYVLATIGIVKLFWPNGDELKTFIRVKLILSISLLFSIFYIFGIYYIVGIELVGVFYKAFIITQGIYCLFGLIAYMFNNKHLD